MDQTICHGRYSPHASERFFPWQSALYWLALKRTAPMMIKSKGSKNANCVFDIERRKEGCCSWGTHEEPEKPDARLASGLSEGSRMNPQMRSETHLSNAPCTFRAHWCHRSHEVHWENEPLCSGLHGLHRVTGYGTLTSTLVPSAGCVCTTARSTRTSDSIWPCRAPLGPGCSWDPPRSPSRPPSNPARTTWSSGSGPAPTAPARRTAWVRTRGSPAWRSSRARATSQCPRPRRRRGARGRSTGSPTTGAPRELAAWRLSPCPGGNADRRSDSPSSTTRCCSSGRCGRSCSAAGRPRSSPPFRPGCAAGRNRWRPPDRRISLPSCSPKRTPPGSEARDVTSPTPVSPEYP